MTTLNDILKEHPEYGDLPVGIYADGEYDFIDFNGNTRGGVYRTYVCDDAKNSGQDPNDENFVGNKTQVLIFTAN